MFSKETPLALWMRSPTCSLPLLYAGPSGEMPVMTMEVSLAWASSGEEAAGA